MDKTKVIVWEQRWHPFRGEWVLFTSHRGGRPWIGETKENLHKEIPAYDPECSLCPGNVRLNGKHNPQYRGVYCFTNDLPCFSNESPHISAGKDPCYSTRPAAGTAEVVCYHPDHNKTLADLDQKQIQAVVDIWAERYEVLGKRPEIDCVYIFENKGELVGTSNPHPHCQIYAGSLVYANIAREAETSTRFLKEHGEPVGLAVAAREMESERVVCSNGSFLACVPWFALFAYEVHILPRFQAASLLDLNNQQRTDLAAILQEVTIRYDNLWQMPMPYIMALHQAPTDGKNYPAYPFHIEFHPPLRKPDTMKYLAGPEVGGGSMTNESIPEEKAEELRNVSNILYRQNDGS